MPEQVSVRSSPARPRLTVTRPRRRAAGAAGLLLLALGGSPPPELQAETTLESLQESTPAQTPRPVDPQLPTHREVLQHIPPYRDPTLSRYLDGVAARLARSSPEQRRDGLSVHVLDDPSINAFALPPGRIYLHRGLIAYLGAEAEIAAVLAIEMAHLALEHWHTEGTMVQGLDRLGLGTLLETLRLLRSTPTTPRPLKAGGPETLTTRLDRVRRGYPAELELAAARTAASYLARAGYAPGAVLGTLEQLAEIERRLLDAFAPVVSEAGYHACRALHDAPALAHSVRSALDAARAENRPASELNREGFLAQIEGLPVGPGAAEGVVRGGGFAHPGLGVSLRFPTGWRILNTAERVLGLDPEQRALLQVVVTRRPPDGRLDRTLSHTLGLRARSAEWRYGDREQYRARAGTTSPFGPRVAQFVVSDLGRHAYVFALVTRFEADLEAFDGALAALVDSLAPLAPGEPAPGPLRLTLVRATPGVDLATLAQQHAPDASTEALRWLNHLAPDAEPMAGSLVKMLN